MAEEHPWQGTWRLHIAGTEGAAPAGLEEGAVATAPPGPDVEGPPAPDVPPAPPVEVPPYIHTPQQPITPPGLREGAAYGSPPLTVPVEGPPAPTPYDTNVAAMNDYVVQTVPQERRASLDEDMRTLMDLTQDKEFQQYPRPVQEHFVQQYVREFMPELLPMAGGEVAAGSPAASYNFGEPHQDIFMKHVLGEPGLPDTYGPLLLEGIRTGAYALGDVGARVLPGLNVASRLPYVGQFVPPLVGSTLQTAADLATRPFLSKQPMSAEEYLGDWATGVGVGTALPCAVKGLTVPVTKTLRHLGLALPKDYVPTEQDRRLVQYFQDSWKQMGGNPDEFSLPAYFQVLKARNPEAASNIGWIHQMLRSSYGGRMISQAENDKLQTLAIVGYMKRLNDLGTTTDNPVPVMRDIIRQIGRNRRTTREFDHALYTMLDTMHDNPSGDTSNLLTHLNQPDNPSMTVFNKRLNSQLHPDLQGGKAFQTTTSVPLSSLGPDELQEGLPIMTPNGPGTYRGSVPRNPGISLVHVPGVDTNMMSTDLIQAQTTANKATMGKLQQVLQVTRRLSVLPPGATNETAPGRDAIALANNAQRVTKMLEGIIADIPMNQDVARYYDMMSKMYARHSETFWNRDLVQSLRKMRNTPDKVAEILADPTGSDTIGKVAAAYSTMPHVLSADLPDPVANFLSNVKRGEVVPSSVEWQQQVLPQLQYQFVKPATRTDVAGNAERVRQILAATPEQMSDADFLKATLFSVDGTQLIRQLETMSQATIAAVFPDRRVYNGLLEAGRALKLVQESGGESAMGLRMGEASGLRRILHTAPEVWGSIGAGAYVGGPLGAIAGGGLGLLAPMILTKIMNTTMSREKFLLAMKNPTTAAAQRIFAQLGTPARAAAVDLAQKGVNFLVTAPQPAPETED